MKDPTADRLRALLDYDPETGVFVWRWRPEYEFKKPGQQAYWNRRYAGRVAGSLSPDGYRYIKFDGEIYSEHRLAWLYCNGSLPDQVDHENGRTAENWIANLRAVSNAENAKNQAIRSTNKSGVAGVCWCPRPPKWQAYIHVDGKQRRLGYFDRLEDAAAARKAAEKKYGYHPNHGRPSL